MPFNPDMMKKSFNDVPSASSCWGKNDALVMPGSVLVSRYSGPSKVMIMSVRV